MWADCRRSVESGLTGRGEQAFRKGGCSAGLELHQKGAHEPQARERRGRGPACDRAVEEGPWQTARLGSAGRSSP